MSYKKKKCTPTLIDIIVTNKPSHCQHIANFNSIVNFPDEHDSLSTKMYTLTTIPACIEWGSQFGKILHLRACIDAGNL